MSNLPFSQSGLVSRSKRRIILSRPRNPLRDYTPAISTGQSAVTVETDMGGQVVTDTFVAGSAGGVNIVLNSLRTSNVLWWFNAAGGESYRYSVYEVTMPSVSAVVFGIQLSGVSAAVSGLNQNLYGKLAIIQRQ